MFVVFFENEDDRKVHTGYYNPKVQIKYYNVMMNGKNLFVQPVKSNMRTYDIILKIATDQGDDYTTGCLLNYNYFNKYYKMIAIYLSKQQALDADPKAIHQINLTRNLERDIGVTMFFINEQAKETALDFSQGTINVLWIYFYFNIISV